MKIGILLFEQFYKKTHIGSSRIRGHWLAKHWPEAEIFKMGQHYDVLIFQKVYWIEYAEMVRKQEKETGRHKIMILDICDADFLQWGHRVKQMVDLCDAVTTSTPALAEFMGKLTKKPVWCIPDRLDLDSFNIQPKVHEGPAKTVAWFGYSENFPMLDSAINSLIKAGIENLVVIASARSPYMLPPAMGSQIVPRRQPDGSVINQATHAKINLVNYPWTVDTVNRDLLTADLVINPQAPKGRFKFKSNNKTITAWALGLPVAHNEEELKALLTADARTNEARKRLKEVGENYDIRQSVESYKKLIAEIEDSLKQQPAGKESV